MKSKRPSVRSSISDETRTCVQTTPGWSGSSLSKKGSGGSSPNQDSSVQLSTSSGEVVVSSQDAVSVAAVRTRTRAALRDDCEFVAVAEMLDVKLVTNDHRLVAAFPDRAVLAADL